MTSNEAYRGVDNRFDAEKFDETEDKISIKDPTSTVFGRPKEGTIDQAAIDRQTQKSLGLDQPEVRGSAAVQRGQIDPPGIDFSFLGGDRFKEGTAFTDAAARQAMTTDEAMGDETKPSMLGDTGGSMNQMSGSLGISADPSATRAAKEAGFASGTIDRSVTGVKGPPSEISGSQILPEAKKTFAQSVSTALKGIGEAVQMFSPIGAIARELGRPVGDSPGAVAHAKNYFTRYCSFTVNCDGLLVCQHSKKY